MESWIRTFGAIFVAIALGGCSAAANTEARMGPGDIPVVVNNQASSTVQIHVVTVDGTSRRLGTVQPLNSETFSLPTEIFSASPYPFHLTVSPTPGDPVFQTTRLVAGPGDRVTLNIDASVRFSTAEVTPR